MSQEARSPCSRARVLEAALELCSNRGYSATSIRHVEILFGVQDRFGSGDGTLREIAGLLRHGMIEEAPTRERLTAGGQAAS